MTDLLEVKNRANHVRNQLGLGQSPIGDIFSLLEDIGIILFKRVLNSNSVSAIFMQDKINYLIIINSNKTLGHQIFSVAHELSHYYYDRELLGGICSVNISNPKDRIEKIADMFAAHLLMPDEGVISVAEKRKNKSGQIDIYDIVFLQQYFRVSWNAILCKLNYLGYIKNIDDYKNIGITKLTQFLGYNTDLISKTQDSFISKRYLEIALKCYLHDEISKTRFDEYLKDVGLNFTDINIESEIISGGDSLED